MAEDDQEAKDRVRRHSRYQKGLDTVSYLTGSRILGKSLNLSGSFPTSVRGIRLSDLTLKLGI